MITSIPVKGSPVWVKGILKYSTGQVTNEGKLIVSNIKGLKHALASTWQVAPRVVYHNGHTFYAKVRTNRTIEQVLFESPTKRLHNSCVILSEKGAGYVVILPKMLPISLA